MLSTCNSYLCGSAWAYLFIYWLPMLIQSSYQHFDLPSGKVPSAQHVRAEWESKRSHPRKLGASCGCSFRLRLLSLPVPMQPTVNRITWSLNSRILSPQLRMLSSRIQGWEGRMVSIQWLQSDKTMNSFLLLISWSPLPQVWFRSLQSILQAIPVILQ